MSSNSLKIISYPHSTLRHVAKPLRRVDALLDEAVANFGSRPAMDFLGRRWTYGELGDLVNRVARGFQDLGVRKGVKVGLDVLRSHRRPSERHGEQQDEGLFI